MSMRTFLKLTGWFVVLLAAVVAQATSHVRIVRLSYVDGKVQMDRANGQGLERAILNAPIVEGSSIVTGRDGLAEIEFENSTTVRLGEATEVRFKQLLINDAGDKVNEVELVRGTMYFTTHGKDEINRAVAANRTFVLRRDSDVRLMMSGDQVQAAVLKGEVTVDNNGQIERAKKKETLTADANNASGVLISKGVDELSLDRWNSERAAYQTAYSYNNTGYGNSGMGGFGYADLGYYGGWFNVPGYGLAWQPYGASSWMGWNPYLSGTWAFTPGVGYAWSSAYPWGWLPFHYGAWSYAPAYGWFWAPGNSFRGNGVVTNWQGTTQVANAPAGFSAPTAPTVHPNGPRPSIMVGRIGNVPSYLPGGPVPPNFRSVITDHSGLAGTGSPSAGSMARNGGGSVATRNSAPTSALRRSSNPSGHVFVQPAQSTVMPSLNSGGYMPSPAMSGGQAGTARSAGASTGTAGGGRAGGTSAGRSGGAYNPK